MLPTFFCRLLPAGYLKCTHMHAHTKSLPSGQAIFKKMYTFAGIFFRWFYVYTCIRSFPPLPILPAFFRSRHTHKNTPLPPSAIYFLHLFFFINPNDREKAISIHFNFIRIKSKEATAEQKKQKKYKNKRICRNKKNVFVNRGFPRTSIKNKRKIKKSKG
ncbi:hypothetical protein [Blautia sp. RTP21359st1_E11_RTP21359_211015]|uniref:hypothetical protein n=1 Tax=Blautia sp. RTP21359st1_E11_RTP21359_211015 TaxID=3141591 RepID=UPI0034A1A6E4